MNDSAFAVAVLEAAIAHARKSAVRPSERRSAALFYVGVVEAEYKGRRLYSRAHSTFKLRRRMQESPLLSSLLEALVAERDASLRPPASNTGVRSPGEAAIEAVRVTRVYDAGASDPARPPYHDRLMEYLEGNQQ